MKKINISSLSARELSDAVNEIRLMASLRHSNIVGYLESFIEVFLYKLIGFFIVYCYGIM